MPAVSAQSSRRGSAATTPTGQSGRPRPQQSSPKTPSPIQSISSQMQSLAFKSTLLPKASGPGKGSGEKLKVLSNHFLMDPTSLPESAYKWTANIKRQSAPQSSIIGRVKRRVLELLLQMPRFNRGIYSDYVSSLWSFVPLTNGPTAAEVIIVDYYEPEESQPRKDTERKLYQVTITSAAAPLPTDPLKALLKDPSSKTVIHRPIQEYEDFLNNVILRFAGQNDRLTTAARGTKIFPLTTDYPLHPTSKRKTLGGGLEVYRGYGRGARLCQGGAYLILSVSHSVMYLEGPLINLITNYRRDNGNDPGELNAFLKGVRVQAKFGDNRVKPIRALSSRKAENTSFACDKHPKTGAAMNGSMVSMLWYFGECYGIRIPPDDMVLNVGTPQRDVWWPASLLHVLPGQSYQNLLPLTAQSQAMIRFACRSPGDNKLLLESEGMEMVGVLNRQGSAAPVVGSPLMVWLSMAEVNARRIASPGITFKNRVISGRDTAKGQWNLQGCIFKTPANLQRAQFTVIALKRQNEPDVTNFMAFVNALSADVLRYCGVKVQVKWVPGVPKCQNWPEYDAQARLKKLFVDCLKHGVQYCFVISSSRSYYSDIKIAADSVGLQTTVTLRKPDNSVKASPGEIANLMLKFSMKVGGINWTLAPADFEKILGSNTMLFGLDVVHPSPGHLPGAPSVAGLVYSTNSNPGQFLPLLMVLPPLPGKQATEIVPNLTPLVVAALKHWKFLNKGSLPTRLFFCRDGVSDQQLQQILDVELLGIKKAAQQVYGDGARMPDVFILNTQKRHMTRFFQLQNDKSSAFDQKGNPLPGLIVDQTIVSRERDDWYAVSHKCLQGQSRPAHHIRVYDELNLSKDALEQIVHNLSFIFPRSVTSVSVPAPARLADILCERAKVHLHEVYFPSPETRERGESYDPNRHFNGQGIHPNIANTMYYL